MNVELNISELSFTATFSSSRNSFMIRINVNCYILKSGPAEPVFKWGGGLMRTGEREQTRGAEGLLPRENVKFKSSEMAINASKTANSNINL